MAEIPGFWMLSEIDRQELESFRSRRLHFELLTSSHANQRRLQQEAFAAGDDSFRVALAACR